MCHVFSLLEQNGLVVNEEKCVFGQASIEFLCHLITAAGSSPLPSRVEAIAVFPRPVIVRQLQALLGLFNFYRKFIPAAAKVVLPLTRNLRGGPRGDHPLDWSVEMVAAFEAARCSLSTTAVLEHPVPKADLSLVTDASATHVGAVIQQRRPGQGWRPLGFFSAQLAKAQTNYSAFDRELFAVVAAIKYFRYMLEGLPFTVFTDHRPLVGALSRRSDPCSSRQQRHLSFIAKLSPVIHHIARQSNVVADTLSRPSGSFSMAAPVAQSESQCSFPAGAVRVAAKGRAEVNVPSVFLAPFFAASSAHVSAVAASSPSPASPVDLVALAAAQPSCWDCRWASSSSVLRVRHHSDGQYIYYGGHILRCFPPPCPRGLPPPYLRHCPWAGSPRDPGNQAPHH
jgi:hypothetical protein